MAKTRRKVLISVPLKDINQSDNSRMTYRQEDLAELMVSMKQSGLLQPIGVRKTGKTYDIIFGNRRYFAAKKLGWETIDAIEVTSDKEERGGDLIKNAIENFQRVDVPLAEQGRIFGRLLTNEKMTASEIAARIGISTRKVRTCIDLFQNVPKQFRERVVHAGPGAIPKKGTVPGNTAFKILGIAQRNNLSKEQKESLFEYGMRDDVKADHIDSIAHLMKKDGMTVNEAIKEANDIVVVNFKLPLHKADVARIEKSTGKSIFAAVEELVSEYFNAKVQRVRSKYKSRAGVGNTRATWATP